MANIGDGGYPRQTDRGIFVVVEGGDGAGKTTACDRLHRLLRDGGHAVTRIDKRPMFDAPFLSDHVAGLATLTWAGQRRDERRLIHDDHWLYLAAAWFSLIDQHCVVPTLQSGAIVLADSWFPKLMARFRLKEPSLGQLAATLFSRLTPPDRIVFLDVAPEIAARRKTSLGYAECGNFDGYSGCTADNFIAYQLRVRHAYHQMAREPRWTTVDASGLDTDAVVRSILDALPSELV